MTRKDYVKFAAMLKELVGLDAEQVNLDWFKVSFVNDFADILQADNPNFDRERFKKACGIES